MACNIVQGDSIDCRDSVGGLGLSLLIGEYGNVPQANITASSGVISAMTCSSGKRLFKYELDKENATFTDSVMVSVENGTTHSEQTLTFTIKKMSASHRNNLLTLAYNRLMIVVKDANGINHVMGQVNGADLTGNEGTSGKALGDMNGYTLTFTAKEPVPANTISDAIYATLQITA